MQLQPNPDSDQRPFAGLRVYDASMGIAGPHCTSLMAMCGADIIKVEPPGGDWCRGIGQQFNGMGAHFLTYNRGKKSVVIDLKSPEGRSTARRLIGTCDIVVESFRPGVMDRLGIGYAALAQERPEIIYVAVSGFGQAGPYSEMPAYDTIIQASSGWMHLNRAADGTPVLMDHIAVDVVTGLYAFQAACAALLTRFRFGKGAFLDISLMQAAAAFLSPRLADFIMAEGKPRRGFDAPMGVWPTADGMLALVIKDQTQFNLFCGILGCPSLAADPRFASREQRMANAASLSEQLYRPLARESAEAWEVKLAAQGIAAARVRDFAGFLSDRHVRETGSIRNLGKPDFNPAAPFIPVPGLDYGAQELTPTPLLGEHSLSVLHELNCREK